MRKGCSSIFECSFHKERRWSRIFFWSGFFCWFTFLLLFLFWVCFPISLQAWITPSSQHTQVQFFIHLLHMQSTHCGLEIKSQNCLTWKGPKRIMESNSEVNGSTGIEPTASVILSWCFNQLSQSQGHLKVELSKITFWREERESCWSPYPKCYFSRLDFFSLCLYVGIL